MRNLLFYVLLAGCAFLLQTTWIPQLFQAFGGHRTIDVILLMLIHLALSRDRSTVLLWAGALGLASDAFGAAWPGAAVASYMIVALLSLLFSPYLMMESTFTIFIFAGVMTAVDAFLRARLGSLLLGAPATFGPHWSEMLTQVFLQAAAAPVVHALLKAADRNTGILPRGSSNRLVIDL